MTEHGHSDYPAIEVSGLVKKYDDFTLGPLDISVGHGKIMGLVGENGAGKTTLLSILLGRRLPQDGFARIEGKSIRQALSQLGFVMDCADFHGSFSLKEIDYYIADIYKQWDSKRFFNLVNGFEISVTKKIDDMSRGTKSKAMLCIALAHNPRVLILDEITSGLDPFARRTITDMIKEHVTSLQTTVLLSTHIIADIEKIADDVCFLHNGQVLLQFSMKDAQSNYAKYNVTNLESLMLKVIDGKG